MCKRLLSALLAFALILTMAPALVTESGAVGDMTTSEECIAILKQMEGFVKMPMWDHSHYSIGYGSYCDPKDYPNGITEEQADALLRKFLGEMEDSLHRFARNQNLIFAQHQFDALMLFTYNCGAGWMGEEGKFRTAVIEGATGNDFIFPMSLWSTASNQLNEGLLKRRLIEADMYLNGSYENQRPANYLHIYYNNNGGTAEARAQGYDCNLYAPVKSLPTREGYRFLGWYTAAEGGSWVTELDASTAEMTLHAHWQRGSGNPEVGTSASYQCTAEQMASLQFRDVPGGTVKGTLSDDVISTIVADYVDANGVKWGKLTNGGWVNLGNPLTGVERAEEEVNVIRVKVTGDYVNVRSGPGTEYEVVTGVSRGDVLDIIEVRKMTDGYWGKFRAGWICLEFTDFDPDQLDQAQKPETDRKEEVIGTGVITASSLNIRRNPSMSSQAIDAYRKGDKVEILELRTVSGTQWGRTDRGWICMDYVKMDKPVQVPEEQPDPTEPQPEEPEATEPEATEPEATEPEGTEPETTEPQPEEPENPQEGIVGFVVSKSELLIRKGPGTNYERVGFYNPGTKLLILEQKVINYVAWGRTDKGWVCMQYVRLDFQNDNGTGVQGTVISGGPLNIRSGAGVYYRLTGTYQPGTRITIFERTVTSGQIWGRTDRGWVCMDYVVLDSELPPVPDTPPTEPETGDDEKEEEKPEQTPDKDEQEETPAATGVVTASGLNIRASAGVNSRVVGAYRKGEKVGILEQKLVDGVFWGRTDLGWISLDYVKITEQTVVPGGFKVTVTANALNIRKGPGTGYAGVDVYRKGQTIVILETKQAGDTKWGRTDRGWVCMDYVK